MCFFSINKLDCDICAKHPAQKTIAWIDDMGRRDINKELNVCWRCEFEIKDKIEKMRKAQFCKNEKELKDGDLAIKFLNKFFENLDV